MLADELLSLGHRVHVLAMDTREGREAYSTLDEVVEGVPVRRMAYRYHALGALADLVNNRRANEVLKKLAVRDPVRSRARATRHRLGYERDRSRGREEAADGHDASRLLATVPARPDAAERRSALQRRRARPLCALHCEYLVVGLVLAVDGRT